MNVGLTKSVAHTILYSGKKTYCSISKSHNMSCLGCLVCCIYIYLFISLRKNDSVNANVSVDRSRNNVATLSPEQMRSL